MGGRKKGTVMANQIPSWLNSLERRILWVKTAGSEWRSAGWEVQPIRSQRGGLEVGPIQQWSDMIPLQMSRGLGTLTTALSQPEESSCTTSDAWHATQDTAFSQELQSLPEGQLAPSHEPSKRGCPS